MKESEFVSWENENQLAISEPESASKFASILAILIFPD